MLVVWIKTQAYLAQCKAKVTVYHMFDAPQHNEGNFKTHGGFETDEERDAAMTWVRSEEAQRQLHRAKYSKRKSGTEKNLERRARRAEEERQMEEESKALSNFAHTIVQLDDAHTVRMKHNASVEQHLCNFMLWGFIFIVLGNLFFGFGFINFIP